MGWQYCLNRNFRQINMVFFSDLILIILTMLWNWILQFITVQLYWRSRDLSNVHYGTPLLIMSDISYCRSGLSRLTIFWFLIRRLFGKPRISMVVSKLHLFPVQCTVCGKSYHSSDQLSHHKKVCQIPPITISIEKVQHCYFPDKKRILFPLLIWHVNMYIYCFHHS